MTSLDEAISDVDPAALVEVLPDTRWERFEAWLGRQSDRLNPILVKEARQALRSRQFTTTFFLMLAAGWTWSILGLALLGPAAYYNATGPSMFYAYYWILAAPLIIVIPYFAYHSLASERHDRTYELVSITALDASRILLGKLGGITMQMVVYLSALFPCLAFTYLLRGLDIFTVLLAVAYTCLLSIGLAMLGLLLATLTASRQRHIIQGVLFAAFLVYAFGMTVALMSEFIGYGGAFFDDEEFLQVNVAMALFYANVFALTFYAARAMLMSPAQNRSTAVRLSLVVAQLTALGWFSWATIKFDDDFVMGLIFCSTFAWYLVGMILVGESPVLSPRVKRALPQSALGRSLLTWFAPGPGTGYLFVLSNMLMLTVMTPLLATTQFMTIGNAATAAAAQRIVNQTNTPGEILETCLVATSYVAIYLGLSKLMLLAIRRFDEVRLTVRVLIGVILVLIGGGVPWIVQITNPATRNLDYTLLQTTNPVWTLWEYCVNGGPKSGMGEWLVAVLPFTALIIWALNMPAIVRELKQTRIPLPQRVTEDDVQLAAASQPVPERTSPWDD